MSSEILAQRTSCDPVSRKELRAIFGISRETLRQYERKGFLFVDTLTSPADLAVWRLMNAEELALGRTKKKQVVDEKQSSLL